MHPLAFYQKRIHLCVLARGREMFAHIEDMTPARFDILFLLYNARPPFTPPKRAPYPMAQSRITAALGLARQTIWKAVERLVELGWITKTKRGTTNSLLLTSQGLQRIREALNAAFSERAPLPRDAPADDPPRWWRRPELADEPFPYIETCEEQIARQLDPRQPPPPSPPPPPPRGREVARIFSAFALNRVFRPGRRGRRSRHLMLLDRWIDNLHAIAEAFGNTAWTIYKLRISEWLHD